MSRNRASDYRILNVLVLVFCAQLFFPIDRCGTVVDEFVEP
jgi:hypothetical protein